MISKYWRYPAALFAFALLGLSVYNASWLAAAPRGTASLVAHRGVAQHLARAGEGCSAARIETPMHEYIANTLPSIEMAKRVGGAMITLDVAATKDGRIALFGDETLDCHTDGTGAVRGKTLAGLKALDPGYGYSADGGKTYPLRGKQAGSIPSLEEALAVAGTKPLLFRLVGNDPADAALLANALKAAGRDVVKAGDGFLASPAGVARIRAVFPKAWAFSAESVAACTDGYLATGWFGVVPEACREGTMVVPLGGGWAYAGWPNKLQERVAAVGGRVILTGPDGEGLDARGLDLPEQIRAIPSSFAGYIWVEDIWTIGPALYPSLAKRSGPQEQWLERNLAARRAARD